MKNFNFKCINKIRDWRIITGVFALGLIIISVFSWQVYLSKEVGGGYFVDRGVENESVRKNLDQNKLKEAVTALKSKQTNFDRVKSNLTKYVDPSL